MHLPQPTGTVAFELSRFEGAVIQWKRLHRNRPHFSAAPQSRGRNGNEIETGRDAFRSIVDVVEIGNEDG